MERILIDKATGEVVGDMNDGDRIIRKESINYLNRKYSSDLKGRTFVKLDDDEGRLLAKELTSYEKAVLFQLQYYVSYESGLIRYPNGREIGFAEIVEMSGLSRRTAAEAINKLIDKDIIYKGKNSKKTQYYMNPWVASKGVVSNPTLKEMFGNYKIRSMGNTRWKDLL